MSRLKEAALLLLAVAVMVGGWNLYMAIRPRKIVYVEKKLQPERLAHLEKLAGFGVLEGREWVGDTLRLHVGTNFAVSPMKVQRQILTDVTEWAWCENERCEGLEVYRAGKHVQNVAIEVEIRAKE